MNTPNLDLVAINDLLEKFRLTEVAGRKPSSRYSLAIEGGPKRVGYKVTIVHDHNHLIAPGESITSP